MLTNQPGPRAINLDLDLDQDPLDPLNLDLDPIDQDMDPLDLDMDLDPLDPLNLDLDPLDLLDLETSSRTWMNV